MRHYRIYRVGADGHFASADNIECADDEAAIQRAQQAVDGQDIELWEQGRFVARFRKPGSVVSSNTITAPEPSITPKVCCTKSMSSGASR